jgi:hypothetical protein
LRGAHARCDHGLRKTELLASSSELAQKLPAPESRVNELGELRVLPAALGVDLVEEVFSTGAARGS